MEDCTFVVPLTFNNKASLLIAREIELKENTLFEGNVPCEMPDLA